MGTREDYGVFARNGIRALALDRDVRERRTLGLNVKYPRRVLSWGVVNRG
jgi:hypothetical protein